MFIFGKKKASMEVAITIKPLVGLGQDLPATLKFLKKHFKKYAGYDVVVVTLKQNGNTRGMLHLSLNMYHSDALKLYLQAEKVGVYVRLNHGLYLSSAARAAFNKYVDEGTPCIMVA